MCCCSLRELTTFTLSLFFLLLLFLCIDVMKSQILGGFLREHLTCGLLITLISRIINVLLAFNKCMKQTVIKDSHTEDTIPED